MKRHNVDGVAIDRASAPERSLTQRLDALDRANDVRTRRAQLKKDLKDGRCSIHMLLLDPPDFILTAKVFDMLLAVPKYGRVKVNKVLTQCRISPSKTIGGLSQRQREELIRQLRVTSSGQPPALRPATPPASTVATSDERPDVDTVAEVELALGLERLLAEGRQVGRLAARAARHANVNVNLDASARKPDPVALQAALRGTLVEAANRGGRIVRSRSSDAPRRDAALFAAIPPQHQDALLRANEIRLARAELKRKVGAGTVTVSEVILNCPSEAASMTIGELLRSQRRWGSARRIKLLARIGMAETTTIGSLTEFQRSTLAASVS